MYIPGILRYIGNQYTVCALCDLPMLLAVRLDNTFHKKRRAVGSMPAVGSSRNSTSGFPTSAIAVDNFLLLPINVNI